MALPLSLSLISTLFIIHAQYDSYHKLTYPEEMGMVDCQLVFNTRDLYDANAPAFCGAPMPCDCDGHAFNNFLLEETTTDIGFNLTDHSSLDFTIYFGQPYLFYSIQFQWQYRNSPINQATSYVSLYDAGLNAWVPHDYKYLPVYGSGSAVDVNATILDKVVSQLRFHLEWNFDSPTGMVQPSGLILWGETATLFPTTEPSQSPTKSPSDVPSQAPTESPTPRSGLVSVLLDDVSVQCCNGSSQQHLSVPDDTITDITYYPCCYPSDDGYFTVVKLPYLDYIYTYDCPSAGSVILFPQQLQHPPTVDVVYATGYHPDIGSTCGSHQFMSDNSFLSQFNIVSLPIELHGGSYNASEWNIPSCLCSMEHPSFVAHNASECIGNPLADLCTVPSDITGYINVDITSYWSVERGECGCKYMFEYLIWEKTHVHPSVTDTIANYTLWHYIPWEVNNFTAYSREYTEQCIEVQVRICSSMCMVGVWSASNKIVDVAMTQFDTGNYLQSLATECYCYVMVDVCTFDPTASPSALPTVSPDISVTQVLESTQSLSGSNAIGIVVSVLMIMAALSWMY
eukprot:1145436_1